LAGYDHLMNFPYGFPNTTFHIRKEYYVDVFLGIMANESTYAYVNPIFLIIDYLICRVYKEP